MGRKNVIYPQDGIVYSSEKGRNIGVCCNMGESGIRWESIHKRTNIMGWKIQSRQINRAQRYTSGPWRLGLGSECYRCLGVRRMFLSWWWWWSQTQNILKVADLCPEYSKSRWLVSLSRGIIQSWISPSWANEMQTVQRHEVLAC